MDQYAMIDVAKARALCEAATLGPWEWWTSNSWKRLRAENDNGGVLCPFVNQYDRHPDLHVNEEDMAFIAAARTLLPEALDEIERLRAEVADLKVQIDRVRGLAFAATNPANWQVRDTPAERIKAYEDVLCEIESGERFWTAQKQLAICQAVVEQVHQAEIERLRARIEELESQVLSGEVSDDLGRVRGE